MELGKSHGPDCVGIFKKDDHGKRQAHDQLESIQEMVEQLKKTREERQYGGDAAEMAYEKAEQTIQEDALSVEVRGAWHAPGTESDIVSEEFQILLCTGGPAVRIMGKLGSGFEPVRAWIEYQDWGTPWTEYRLTAEEEETVLTYARCFYFGE